MKELIVWDPKFGFYATNTPIAYSEVVRSRNIRQGQSMICFRVCVFVVCVFLLICSWSSAH